MLRERSSIREPTNNEKRERKKEKKGWKEGDKNMRYICIQITRICSG